MWVCEISTFRYHVRASTGAEISALFHGFPAFFPLARDLCHQERRIGSVPKKDIAQFTVSHLQILDENGKVDKDLEPDLSDDFLLEMYRWMRLNRLLDDRMLKLQRQGRLGTFPPSTGQEAISVAAAMAMQENDWFAGAFRELGGRMVRGEPMTLTLHYYNGWEEGNVQPSADLRIMPNSVVIGCQIPQAAGLAFAGRYRGEDSAVVAFIGDGGTSQGDFYEGLNFAGVWKAPVVYIIQNNQWAISVPREVQTASVTLAQKGIAAGMPVLQVDGNDPLAMYVAVKEALDRARAGEGPTLIEAVTYRLMMHTTADDPTKYRSKDEEDQAWTREPLIRFRKYLEGRGCWDDKKEDAQLAELKAQIDEAVQEFEKPTGWTEDEPFKHVYGTEHDYIKEQHQEFLAELERGNE
jgi:pyruvate dehydrogenase E1 component alpha subunit